jgi:hypothetical protein
MPRPPRTLSLSLPALPLLLAAATALAPAAAADGPLEEATQRAWTLTDPAADCAGDAPGCLGVCSPDACIRTAAKVAEAAADSATGAAAGLLGGACPGEGGCTGEANRTLANGTAAAWTLAAQAGDAAGNATTTASALPGQAVAAAYGLTRDVGDKAASAVDTAYATAKGVVPAVNDAVPDSIFLSCRQFLGPDSLGCSIWSYPENHPNPIQ